MIKQRLASTFKGLLMLSAATCCQLPTCTADLLRQAADDIDDRDDTDLGDFLSDLVEDF
ncbi:MAG: hypothetical protein IID37_07205 [Planctomycetes bacterium]|nr:hypothetical protein [Planctomycetota bacterium]